MKNIFEKIILPIFGIFGTLITLLAFIFPTQSNGNVSLKLYVITILFLLLIISILIKLLLDYRSSIYNKTFNNFRITPIQFVPDDNILILNKNILLPMNISVTVFLKEGIFEKAIALGYVSHIQEEFIQVKLIGLLEKGQYITQFEIKNMIIRPASNVTDIVKLISGEAK